MTVNRVGTGMSPLAEYPKKGKGGNDLKVNVNDVSDKIEISEEAKVKNSEIRNNAKLAEIKDKINSGFYNKDGVISSVADSILKEIRGA